jgi:hypothetical protein
MHSNENNLEYNFYYKFKEITTEKYGDVCDVIIEVRFFHCLNTINNNQDDPEVFNLMVVHFEYVEGQPYYTSKNLNKQYLIDMIEKKLGDKELKRMEEILKYKLLEKLNLVTKKKITLDL